MTTRRKLPKYITCDIGPDKKERFYFRRPKKPKVRIEGVPWTPAFMARWAAAMGGENVVAITPGPIVPRKVNDFNWLLEQYYETGEWKGLDDALSKPMRGRIYRRVARMPIKDGSKVLFGDVPLTAWNRQAVRAIRDRHAETPSMSNEIVKALHVLFRWAVDADHIETNPAAAFRRLKPKNADGHHTWTLEEVETFESTWAMGTQERLALGLLLYTGQRASDVRQFGPEHVKQHEDGKWLDFTQHKNRNSKPVHLQIPLRPELEKLIDGIETKTFLAQASGKPHTRASFTEFFAGACIAANVPGRSHGLRKAAATRLADNSATEKEIMSITGHTTMKEVERYTKAANQKKLAAAATKRGA
jgi:integrase